MNNANVYYRYIIYDRLKNGQLFFIIFLSKELDLGPLIDVFKTIRANEI